MKARPALRPAVALAVFLLAWWRATAGIEWSVGYHPDELPVARWIDGVRRDGYIRERPYPCGWFQLARIAAWAGDRADALRAANARRRSQEGAAVVMDPATFRRAPPPPPRTRHGVQRGRDLNALLYAATALLLFLAAGAAGLGTAGAAASAAFFLCLPAPLEHAHYCETDLGVLASLALSFWAMAAAARRRSLPLVLAAGFAAGFCVACKYTVAPLALVPPALGAALGARGRRPGRATAWAGLALLGTLAGFVAGTPVLYRAPALVLAALRAGRTPTPEAGGLAGRAGGLVRETAKAGALPLLWAAVSVPFWFRRPWRRALAGPALFVPLYLAGAFALLPWFRNQETLPILAALSLGAGLPVAAALREPPEERLRRAPLLAAGAALLAAALASGLVSSSRMLSSFRRREMRAECRGFLAERLPRGASAAADSYVRRGMDGLDAAILKRNHIPERYPDSLSSRAVVAAGPRYLLRDASHEARRGRRREAFSGRTVPEAREAVAAFRRDAALLRAWRLPAGWTRPVFAQHDAELWLLPSAPDAPGRGLPDVPLAFARPLAVLPRDVPLQEASGPAWAGPHDAMRAVGRRAEILQPRDGAPRWAVALHAAPDGSPVRLVWSGAFRPLSGAPLAPGGASAAAAPALSPHTLASDLYRASRVRFRGDQSANAVVVFVTPDPAEAAFALRRAGDPAAGLALLRGAPDALESAAGRTEALLCAAAAGEEPDPAWRRAAAEALAEADALLAAAAAGPFPGAATLGGVPLEAVRDLSRLRTDRSMVAPGMPLPVYAPAGDYRLEVAFAPGREAQVLGRVLLEGQAEPFSAVEAPADAPRAAAALRLPADGFLRFRADLPPPVADDALFLRSAELSWDPLERIAEAADALRAALRISAPEPLESAPRFR